MKKFFKTLFAPWMLLLLLGLGLVGCTAAKNLTFDKEDSGFVKVVDQYGNTTQVKADVLTADPALVADAWKDSFPATFKQATASAPVLTTTPLYDYTVSNFAKGVSSAINGSGLPFAGYISGGLNIALAIAAAALTKKKGTAQKTSDAFASAINAVRDRLDQTQGGGAVDEVLLATITDAAKQAGTTVAAQVQATLEKATTPDLPLGAVPGIAIDHTQAAPAAALTAATATA